MNLLRKNCSGYTHQTARPNCFIATTIAMLSYLLVLFAICASIYGFEQVPVPTTNKKGIIKPLIAAGLLIPGLIVGKKLIDGPMFDESVILKGKNVVITGANTGLGRATAMKMAALGANTYLMCKTPASGEATVAEIKQMTGNQNVENIALDLRSLKSIEAAANTLKGKIDNLHILINNAGVMALPQRVTTEDGFEAHMGVNHLGHYALTGHLMDLLMKEDPTNGLKRLINVASNAHYFGKIDRLNLMLDKPGTYEPWPAYGNSKQANILFTTALASKMKTVNANRQSSPILAVACHPGLCRTDLGRYYFDFTNLPVPLTMVAAPVANYVSKSSERGAQTQIYLAASNKVSTADAGKYFDNSAPAFPYPEAVNPDLAEWLWHESERLTGMKYKL